ncbi:MAG: hypothetical protein WDW38_003974 [Sanguina aurantia]
MSCTMRCSIASRTAVVSRRTAVVVRAESVDRRAFLGLGAAVLSTLLAPVMEASAMKITSQEFTGGMVKGGGSSPKSGSSASQEGYTLDGYPGTKKPSYIEPKKRGAMMAKVRAKAEAAALLGKK